MEIQPIYLPVIMSRPIEKPAFPQPPEVEPVAPIPTKSPGPHAARPRIVLVSGVNYPHGRGKIGDIFGEYCKRIAPRLNKKYPNAIIRFFSFHDGKQYELNFDSHGNLGTPTVIKDYGALNRENYRYRIGTFPVEDTIFTIKDPNEGKHTIYLPGISDISKTRDITQKEYLDAFYDGTLKERSISMKHVYEYIAGLANYAPKSLAEFHIFSHAYFRGPILVNTVRFSNEKKEFIDDKKYLDKDCRTTDFYEPEVVDMFDFSGVFANDGFSVLWGCQTDLVYRDIILQIVKSPLYKSGEAFKDRSKPFIKLKYDLNWLYHSLYTEEIFRFEFDDGKSDPYGEMEMKSLDDLAKSFEEMVVRKSYARYLADYSGRDVRAALPGTAANLDNERTQTSNGLSLMHIFMGTSYGDPAEITDYRKIMAFYKDVMGFEFIWDVEEYDKVYKRGYATYKA
jgi:hypothetical protein